MAFFRVVLLLLSALLARAADDFNNMFNKPCPNFRCAGGLTPVPKPRVTFESPGCGAMGGGLISFSANDDDNKPFSTCCDQWHACYQICGTSKSVCDDSFKTCSEQKCGGNEECKKSANLQSMMSTLGGCQKFDQSQYAACECVKSSKAPAKREKVIRKFYETFSPETVAKSSDLAVKADSVAKMAGLFRKLVAKYPNCIKMVEDKEKVKYDQMMKETRETEDVASDVVDEEEVEEEEDDERVEL
jgi:hypothetical protein